MGYGKIRDLAVRDGDPVFGAHTAVLVDVKLDATEIRRPEQDLTDFELRAEVVRLFHNFDLIGSGAVEHVEVRGGLPVRMLIKDPEQL